MHDIKRVEIRDPAAAGSRLRIAVTEACNLRCFFCHGDGGSVRHFTNVESGLSPKMIRDIAKLATKHGVTHIKLTGGEPLLYGHPDGTICDVVRLVKKATVGSPADISMVSNGILLSPAMAGALADAGLDRITISLHASRESTFDAYARPGNLHAFDHVLDGIKNAVSAGLKPVKLNSVVYYSRSDKSLRNIDQMREILRLGGELGVDEVKFFVVLPNPRMAEKHYRDTVVSWNDSIFRAFYGEEFHSAVSTALGNASITDSVFPGSFRVRFKLGSGCSPSPEFTFQNFLSSRSTEVSQAHCHLHPVGRDCQEGSYALRLLNSGHLKACLWDEHERDLVGALKQGDTVKASQLFRSAQNALHAQRAELVVA